MEVLNCGRAPKGHRNHMIVLKVECVATLYALAAIALEDRSPDFTRDGFTPPRGCDASLVDIQQHVRPVKFLR